MSPSRATVLAAFLLCQAPAWAADFPTDSRGLQALSHALDAGAERACAPVAYTLSGPVRHGSRLFVSAPADEFLAQLRVAAKGPNKLSKVQASELDRVLRYGRQARASGSGFPAEALERFSEQTGLSLRADMLCLSREILSGGPKR
jgi:hypothetical protein